MTWDEALEVVAGRTGHARFRELCADGNPDASQRDGYRALMVRLATGEEAGADGSTPADRLLRADVEAHGCGGCP